jgi:hypothetical protein
VRIADQDRPSLCFFNELKNGREDARLGHPRLVDEEHAAARQAAFAVRVEEQAMERRASDARHGLELVGGAAARSGAEHRRFALAVGLGQDAQRGRLAGAGGAGDAEDTSWSPGSLVGEHPLVARELASRLHQQTREDHPVRARSVDVPARERKLERAPLDLEQLGS